MKLEFKSLNRAITTCKKCPRLRAHCIKTSEIKKKAYENEKYYGKPITGFGDINAKLIIVGLAPAAHGANRTGRIFTGDRSGEWLYGQLYASGFSNQPTSKSPDDGLALKGAYITCAARCAPPQNKPTQAELAACSAFLAAELKLLNRAKVYLVLGKIALDQLWPLLEVKKLKKPKFGHSHELRLPSGKLLLMSYHPSQQNTFTGRLTKSMWNDVFERAKNELLS